MHTNKDKKKEIIRKSGLANINEDACRLVPDSRCTQVRGWNFLCNVEEDIQGQARLLGLLVQECSQTRANSEILGNRVRQKIFESRNKRSKKWQQQMRDSPLHWKAGGGKG